MKTSKKVALILLIVFSLLLQSCIGSIGSKVDETTQTPETTQAPDTISPPVTTEFVPLPLEREDGMNFGYEFFYNALYQYLPRSDSEEYKNAVKEFFEKYRDLAEEHCPNSTWYVVQKVGYTREEIEEAVRELIPIDLRSEEMYQGFLTSNLGESMQILKRSTSFYHDEKLYTFLDIYNMSEGGRKEYPFDVTLPEYDDEWLECYPLVIQRCSKGVNSYGPYYGYAHDEVIAFIESHIARIRSRKSEDTTSAPETTSPPVTTEFENEEFSYLYLSAAPNAYINSPYGRYARFLYVYLPDWGKNNEEFEKHFNDYKNIYGLSSIDRPSPETSPSITYYLVQKMGYTRKELEQSFADVTTGMYFLDNPVPEYVYEGLLTSDLKESMQLLKNPHVLYYDGGLYTFYDLYNLSEGGTKEFPFDVSAREHDDEWCAMFALYYGSNHSVAEEERQASLIKKFFEDRMQQYLIRSY